MTHDKIRALEELASELDKAVRYWRQHADKDRQWGCLGKIAATRRDKRARGYKRKADAVRQLIKENEQLRQKIAEIAEAAYREAYEITPNHKVTATEKHFAVISSWQSSQTKQRLDSAPPHKDKE